VPPTVSINHYRAPSRTNGRVRGKPRPVPLSHADVFIGRQACFEHSNFFKVNDPEPWHQPVKVSTRHKNRKEGGGNQYTPNTSFGGGQTGFLCKIVSPRNPTTSFLTATTLIYAIGAGITAGAGTRLVLQLFLVKGFTWYSCQLQGPCRVLQCYLLSLPPRVESW